MIDAEVLIRGSAGWRRVPLGEYLDPDSEERAHDASHDWIKGLRNLPVDGIPFRARFTAREDSLWWFTEIYLHKQQVILEIHRTLAAVDRLIEREGPAEIRLGRSPLVVRHVAAGLAAARGIPCADRIGPVTWWRRLARLDVRARALTAAAYMTAERFRREPAGGRRPDVAAFIHRAFWRGRTGEASAESYIGPVLQELEHRLGPGAVQYVGVGPAVNFRTRRRLALLGPDQTGVIPVERFAPARRLTESRQTWRRRREHLTRLTRSEALRESAIICGVDCWPLVREELAGVAWLQWPWSVRAMDEAAAALDRLQPSAVLTYAEAGGWGRALLLEARRRSIPSAGLQHGFIYRHWLNYRHEPDEMQPHHTAPFPLPTRTLVFDQYAARHLTERGRFPPHAVQITGSPRLEELAVAVRRVRASGLSDARRQLCLRASDALVLITTKEKEAREVIGPFLVAAGAVADAVVVIKPHPAETGDQYAEFARQYPFVRIVAPDTPLANLLAVARAVVTVNSTVALDAAAFDIPALVIGLPNNLSPFVDAGALAGSGDPAELPSLLHRVLHDAGFRRQLAERRRTVLGELEPSAPPNGRAAQLAAEAVLTLVRGNQDG